MSALRHPVRRPRRDEARGDDTRRGFSVVEVLVALVVLGLGIMGLANLFPLGMQSQMGDRLRTSAVDLAQQKMEQLRLKPWTDPVLDPGVHPNAGGETLTLAAEGTFQRWWFVDTYTGGFADMKKVTVRVAWTHLRPDTTELVTYFRR